MAKKRVLRKIRRWEETGGLPDLVCRLGDREFRLLTDVAKRLLMGQHAYGVLTKKKKRWRREALEEAMDGMVYLGAAIQDLDDEENGTD